MGRDPQRRPDLDRRLASAGVGAIRRQGLLGVEAVKPLRVSGGDTCANWLAMTGEDDPFPT